MDGTSPDGAGPRQREIPGINTSVPHPARVYDYFLGGKDNYEADRVAGEAGVKAFQKTVESARAARAFLRRVVRYLVGEIGIRQFLDIGTGLPSGENVHQVAQSIAKDAKIVYADNDPDRAGACARAAPRQPAGRRVLSGRGPARARDHPR
jgi:hypothetical protein